MYYRDFHYYDYTISYRELVHGYNLVELEKRRKMASMYLLRDFLRGNLDSPYLLGQIGLKVPVKHSRARSVLAVHFVRTTQAWHAPSQTMVREYNALTGVQPELDVFHGSKSITVNWWQRRLSCAIC